MKANALLLLDKGKLLARGDYAQLQQHPKFLDFISHL
jgi:hypothetical protein